MFKIIENTVKKRIIEMSEMKPSKSNYSPQALR